VAVESEVTMTGARGPTPWHLLKQISCWVAATNNMKLPGLWIIENAFMSDRIERPNKRASKFLQEKKESRDNTVIESCLRGWTGYAILYYHVVLRGYISQLVCVSLYIYVCVYVCERERERERERAQRAIEPRHHHSTTQPTSSTRGKIPFALA